MRNCPTTALKATKRCSGNQYGPRDVTLSLPMSLYHRQVTVSTYVVKAGLPYTQVNGSQ